MKSALLLIFALWVVTVGLMTQAFLALAETCPSNIDETVFGRNFTKMDADGVELKVTYAGA